MFPRLESRVRDAIICTSDGSRVVRAMQLDTPGSGEDQTDTVLEHGNVECVIIS